MLDEPFESAVFLFTDFTLSELSSAVTLAPLQVDRDAAAGGGRGARLLHGR